MKKQREAVLLGHQEGRLTQKDRPAVPKGPSPYALSLQMDREDSRMKAKEQGLGGWGPEVEGLPSRFTSDLDFLTKLRMSDELAQAYPEIDPETMDALVELAWQRLKGERGSLVADGTYDELDKMMLGGLPDGGKEAGLDGGRKEGDSRDGGEVLWREAETVDGGGRSRSEGARAFMERAKAEEKIVKKSRRGYYAYQITSQESYATVTREALEVAKEWGLAPRRQGDGSFVFPHLQGIRRKNRPLVP